MGTNDTELLRAFLQTLQPPLGRLRKYTREKDPNMRDFLIVVRACVIPIQMFIEKHLGEAKTAE
jgi:hypothetical protein